MEPAPSAEAPRAPLVGWLVVAATAAVLTVAFTAPYGTLNHQIYLLDPLHRAMPELFRRDWFVSDTPPYLPAYGWLAHWLYVLDSDGAVAMLAANFVITFATYAALYWLVTSVLRGARGVVGFVIVASFVTVTMGRAMGGNYLLAGYFQPMVFGTLGWIPAMAALARGRYRWCGVLLAVSGVLHVNYLVLGIGLFTLAALAQRTARRRDLAWLIAPQLIALAFALPDLLAAASPSAQAVRVMVDFFAPGHYRGDRLTSWIPELAGWQLAGFAVLPLVEGARREARTLWRFSLIAFAVSVATALLVRIPVFESLTQVRWSRIAPFGQLACQVLVVAALVGQAGAPPPSLARRAWGACGIAVALLLNGRQLHTPWPATALAIACVVAALAAPAPLVRHAGRALAVIALAAALWASPRGRGMTTVPDGSPGELALERWARDSTPVDALFAAPPDLYRFRLLARRAVIVDTKSVPLQPALLVPWYRRLCDVVERPDVPTHEAVEKLWYQLTPDQLLRVSRKFGADYLIVAPSVHLPGAPVYANPEFAVYRVP